VAFEIVPGISSVVAALNYAGIPLTHRDYCSSFTVITGHEDPELEETGIDWQQLAGTPGTKVVLMGLKNIRQIMRKLIEHGLAEVHPRGHGPLGDAAATANRHGNGGDHRRRHRTRRIRGARRDRHRRRRAVARPIELVRAPAALWPTRGCDPRPKSGGGVVRLLAELGAEVLELP
jgi:hypothetical protein